MSNDDIGVPAPLDQVLVAQRGDALALLRSLLTTITPLVFFDPQFREVLDKLAYGNEGARQVERPRVCHARVVTPLKKPSDRHTEHGTSSGSASG